MRSEGLHVIPEQEAPAQRSPQAKEAQRWAFEPFFTTKEKGLGTGLGLSVSYFTLTENHRGQMSAVSSPGKGSAFSILLPIRKTDNQQKSNNKFIFTSVSSVAMKR